MSRPLASANADFGSYERPDWLEAISAVAMVVALAVYLPILLNRTIDHGFGDVQVFFRAGWAVWTGYPLYEVTDLHGWSYHYPPIFALMMGPFADPLPGFRRFAYGAPLAFRSGLYAISIAAMLLCACLGQGNRRPCWRPVFGRSQRLVDLRVGPLLPRHRISGVLRERPADHDPDPARLMFLNMPPTGAPPWPRRRWHRRSPSGPRQRCSSPAVAARAVHAAGGAGGRCLFSFRRWSRQ
jgi:hypothetical protein